MEKCSVPQCGRYYQTFLKVVDPKYEDWQICMFCLAEKFGVSLKKKSDNIRVGNQSLEEFIKKEEL